MGLEPIMARVRQMFWAPTRRRHYASLKQACRAEAGAIVTREWRADGNNGSWLDNEECRVRRAHIAAKLEDQYRAAIAKNQEAL